MVNPLNTNPTSPMEEPQQVITSFNRTNSLMNLEVRMKMGTTIMILAKEVAIMLCLMRTGLENTVELVMGKLLLL